MGHPDIVWNKEIECDFIIINWIDIGIWLCKMHFQITRDNKNIKFMTQTNLHIIYKTHRQLAIVRGILFAVLIFWTIRKLFDPQWIETHLARVRPETAFCGEPFATNVAVEGSVLEPLDLRLVVPEVLLQVGQLDERAATLGDVAFVGALSWTGGICYIQYLAEAEINMVVR